MRPSVRSRSASVLSAGGGRPSQAGVELVGGRIERSQLEASNTSLSARDNPGGAASHRRRPACGPGVLEASGLHGKMWSADPRERRTALSFVLRRGAGRTRPSLRHLDRLRDLMHRAPHIHGLRPVDRDVCRKLAEHLESQRERDDRFLQVRAITVAGRVAVLELTDLPAGPRGGDGRVLTNPGLDRLVVGRSRPVRGADGDRSLRTSPVPAQDQGRRAREQVGKAARDDFARLDRQAAPAPGPARSTAACRSGGGCSP